MRMTFLRRPLLVLLALAFALSGMFAVSTSASATTSYTFVTKCTKTKAIRIMVKGHWKWKTKCIKSKRVKVAVKVSTYKPKYNLMTSVGSKRKLPAKLVAVCGDDKKLYSAVTSTSCKGHGGIAWCVNKKSSKYCPQY